MNLGIENKRNAWILGGLVVVCGYALYTNVLAGPSVPPAARRPAEAPVSGEGPPAIAAPSKPAPRTQAIRGRNEEFHPALIPKRQEDRPDLTKIDPRLHLELLAKLRDVAAEGSGRNLFQFGPPPPPPSQKNVVAKLPNAIEPVVTDSRQTAPPLPPAAAQAPPLPFKYYGVITVRTTGRRTALLQEGDDTYQAAEGELVKKRYRVVRIGVNSVVMEDIEMKRQQTLPLAEDAGANAG